MHATTKTGRARVGNASSVATLVLLAWGAYATPAHARRQRSAPPTQFTAPELLFPFNGFNTGRAGTVNNAVQGTSLRPLFRWTSVTGATSYEVQWTSECAGRAIAVCAFANATNVVVTTLSTQPAADLVVSSVQPVGTQYTWRVRACKSDGVCSSWSTSRNVNVGRVDNDLNGDGFSDWAMSGEDDHTTQTAQSDEEHGAVSVFYGSSTQAAFRADTVLRGVMDEGSFGNAVSIVGDLNGDGYAELVVAAPETTVNGQEHVGTANVYFGSAQGIGTVPAQVLRGSAAKVFFGGTVVSMGDVNGDGFSDVGVVEHYQPNRAVPDEERETFPSVRVYHGSASGLGATPSTVLNGTIPFSMENESFENAGDLNGDGYSDFVMSAQQSVGSRDVGIVRVYQGSANGLVSSVSRELRGAADESFGGALASVGDLNGDGYSDLVVGAHQASPRRRGWSGAASVYLGSRLGIGTRPARVIQGATATGTLGQFLSYVGDVNGDGYSDLAVGAKYEDFRGVSNAGTVRLYHGSAAGLSTSENVVLGGSGTADAFGIGLEGIGDMNGDGFADLFVAAPDASPNGVDRAGSMFVYVGSANGILETPKLTWNGTVPSDAPPGFRRF